MALIDAGKRAGLLRFDDADEAYHTLYGLVVSDLHVRMLLGEDPGLQGFRPPGGEGGDRLPSALRHGQGSGGDAGSG